MYQLSVLVPGIRNENWMKLYESVAAAFSGTWEIIFVGPYALPEELKSKDNVQYIQSWRSPIASQQQALIASYGDLITYAADDGEYLPGSLDIAVKLLEDEPYTTIVTAKYFEGGDPNGTMGEEAYYKLRTHDSMQLPGVPDCYMLNCGVINRSLLMELGGWDSYLFETCPLAYTDFAIRAYRFECKFILQAEPMFTCTHEPGETGTHGPIHRTQITHDQPLFNGIYLIPATYLIRQNIPVDNWRKSSPKWMERFGE